MDIVLDHDVEDDEFTMNLNSATILFLASLFPASAIATTTPALADTSFVGFATQLESGYAHNTTSHNVPVVSSNGVRVVGEETGSIPASGVALFINPEYSFFVAPQWRMGVGIDHQFIAANSRSVGTHVLSPTSGLPLGYYEQITDETNVFVAPGYVIADDKLAFVKLGYSFEAIDLNGKDSKATTKGGFVIGAGYQQVIAGHFFGTLEAHYSRYATMSPMTDLGAGATLRVNTGTPSAVDYLVGIGYRF